MAMTGFSNDRRSILRSILAASTFFASASVASLLASPVAAESDELKLDRAQVENIVRRSYQYVALYNVLNKQVTAIPSAPMGGTSSS
jgi:hypothetical protein